ncbi:MAG: alpha/beta hydrolase [Deltaproteobacteria bacterium]|nr:alpha/beta hydrolase [Deltaproteobacteria bacterium]
MKDSKPTRPPLKILLPIAVLLLAAASACAPNARNLWEREVRRGWREGFRPMDLSAPPFRLAALLRGETGPDLVVYLEGDGRAVVRGRPAMDPTPTVAQSLDLALQDPGPLVLYLARVGQFMPAYAGQQYQVFWSSGRLAPEVVQAASLAIDEVKARTGAVRVHLIGFSGGGGLAVLLSARRTDVASLVTVAGLLDIDWWVQNSGWQPLAESMNPAVYAKVIAGLPQIHFFGTSDRLITPAMSLRFSSLAAFSDLARVGLGHDHYSGWTGSWPRLLREMVLPLRERAGAAGQGI